MRDSGVGLALDDSGTGYTSLAYLKRFPVDKLKLDRAFVTDIHKSRTDAALVKSECLQEMGFKLAQGYMYARPQPEDDFVALLHTNSNPATQAIST